MDKDDVALKDLEQLVALMVQALETLDCPPNCGPSYEFIEIGAKIYLEHRQYAYLMSAISSARLARKTRQGGS